MLLCKIILVSFSLKKGYTGKKLEVARYGFIQSRQQTLQGDFFCRKHAVVESFLGFVQPAHYYGWGFHSGALFHVL
jgi:hypothetical protein